MTTEQIQALFNAAIEEKAIYNELQGISEDKIYNWRKGRGAKPSIGDMLNVLHQLKKIEVNLIQTENRQERKVYHNGKEIEALHKIDEILSK